MAHIAFLLPNEDMLAIACEVAKEQQLDMVYAEVSTTENALSKVEAAVAAGADLIVARGLQARMIREHASVPVVEVLFTSQELMVLIAAAKEKVSTPRPHIGLIGYRNMFGDTTVLSRVMGVTLNIYSLDEEPSAAEVVGQAVEDGNEVLIGGVTICQYATERKMPSVFLASGREGIEEACRVAKRVVYAIDLEKRNTAELQAILDYTGSSLIQVGKDCRIRNINHSAENLLNTEQSSVVGKLLETYIPDLGGLALAPVLQQGRELNSIKVHIAGTVYLASVSPIWAEQETAGAIVTITDSQQIQFYMEDRRREMLRQKHSAPGFSDVLITRSPEMAQLTERAKRYAKFNVPLLILGAPGTEKVELARYIHHAGPYAELPFFYFDCGSVPEQKAEEALFGADGLALCSRGVLYVEEVSLLPPSAQYRLFCLISSQRSSASEEGPPLTQLRVMASSSRDLAGLVAEGYFREELYYALGTGLFIIPPLCRRRDDILGWAEFYLRQLQKQHGRYLHLTRNAWSRVCSYDWPGNLPQLYGFLERLIAESPRQTVDDKFVELQLQVLPVPCCGPEGEKQPLGEEPLAARISELLAKHGGRRAPVAETLGISTTTLWRYMKKYHLK